MVQCLPMQPTITHPRWFHWLRGLVVGLVVGAAVMALAYEWNLMPVGAWTIFPYAVVASPAVVLAPFELYFAVRHYRAVRREMDGRAVSV